MSFEVVTQFEKEVSSFFGSPYAVAVDSCTHGIELCLRYLNVSEISVPIRTYLSIAFLAEKLNIKRKWNHEKWEDYYNLTDNIIDAAVLWKRGGYIPGTLMSLSFQFQKHLSIGRGGMILLDDEEIYYNLTKMAYDGRSRNVPWRNQNIDMVGYHYYMTPESAQRGLDLLPKSIETTPRKWKYEDWPNLMEMEIFKSYE